MEGIGKSFRVTLTGGSHSPSMRVVVEGVAPGLALSAADFAADIDRRRSGAPGTTPRRESDIPKIISGVNEGLTTGEPLVVEFRNENVRPSDYGLFKDVPRPGHADYTARVKYGDDADLSGGGQFSGRMTLPIVAAGVVAKKQLGPSVQLDARLLEVGGQPNSALWEEMIAAAQSEGDSLGGIVECVVSGVPAGIGDPFWDSVESLISHAVFAIPGVRGIEFGDGFAASRMKGSEHNDPFGDGFRPLKNGAGGINGGITNGREIVFRVAFKPASSIRKAQRTWSAAKCGFDDLVVPGRHDTCFALRTPVVVEAVAAIVLADLIGRG